MKINKKSECRQDLITDLTDLRPIMHRGKNLTTLGASNVVSTIYGEKLARELFTDEELSTHMLFPVRGTGRGPLSPNRSAIFKEAVSVRFSDNEDDINAAIAAVNQLGIDLKRNRRRRRVLDL